MNDHQWQYQMTQLISQQLTKSKDPQAVGYLCAAVGLPRSTFYRQRDFDQIPIYDMEVRDLIQRIALIYPYYGYRRISAELQRKGFPVNHKRVLRLMRADNLLCLRSKRSFVSTTDSRHKLTVYPNLIPDLVLSNINQLWVADITYIRLFDEFIYLAVILDAFSRRVIGWELSSYIDTELTLSALRMALRSRRPLPQNLIHHSDRGVQYAATAYTQLLHDHDVQISMSRPANPYDNAKAERFMRTLKHEEVYLTEYQNLIEARKSISQFLEKVYNRKRLHSAIGYVPPVEFEQSLKSKSYT
jgi:transposase InsO family protein